MKSFLLNQTKKVDSSRFFSNGLNILCLLLVTFLSTSILAQAGALDVTYTTGSGASGNLAGICVQPDDKVIISGSFTTYNGTARSRIARINTNGTIDAAFTPGTGANNTTYGPVLQPDGKMIVFGNFTSYNGTARTRIARVNANGTLDATFTTGTGANNWIYAVAIQSDGKIIIGGSFTSYNGTAVSRIARLNTNGTIDLTFNSGGSGMDNYPYTMSTQSDGKIVIGGAFTTYNGTSRSKIVRINTDGSLDATFNPGTGANAAGLVYTTAIQNDGKILIGGSFTTYNGTAKNRFVRLNSNGTIDGTLLASTGANNTVYSINVASDYKIIISGFFTTFNSTSINRIVCLNEDGTLNSNFNSGVGTGSNNYIYTSALQSDGKVLIGGAFTTYNGTTTTRIARINRPCANATLPVLSATSSTICSGQSATLSIASGTLNDATSWEWYTGGCSGTSLGTGSNVVVSPTITTVYYSRGEGSCTTPLSCSSITITVNPNPVISISSNTSICNGGTTTSTVNATGGTGTITYNWMPGNLSGTSQVLTPPSSATTTYTATATDVNGCSALASQAITVASCAGSQLSPTSCGITLTALDQTLTFLAVSGATNYRLEITNAQQPFNVVNVRGNNLTTFKMSYVPGIQYGRTYSIRVASYVGGAWQAYGNTCTVTTPASAGIPTTQFSSGSCNVTLNSLDQTLNFALVSGATNYRFEIINVAQPFNLVNVRNNTVSYFKLSWVTGIQYGRAYDIRISAYVNNTWQPYGSTCTITTPATIPTTQMSASSCGITESSKSQILYFDAVAGASNYRIEVVNATQPLNVVNVRNSTANTFNMSYIASAQVGNTYDLRVAAYVGNAWAAYGPVCQVTIGGPKDGFNGFDNSSTRKGSLESGSDNSEIFVNVYPNPTNGELNVESSESIKSLMVYNLSGELISAEENTNQIDISKFTNGLYVIHVKTENSSKIVKINKQ